MGTFGKLFGRDDPQIKWAQSLVEVARISAITSLPALAERFPLLDKADREGWDFFATIAGVFIATSRLEKIAMTEEQKRARLDAIESRLTNYKSDAIRAFEDCKVLFEREFDRRSALGQDARFISADALGLWIFLNVFQRQPTNLEDANVARFSGTMVIDAVFDFWE